MKKVWTGILPWVIAPFLLASCEKDETTPVQPPPPACKPKYNPDIKTIINTKCAVSGCHDGNSGIVGFKEYATLKERADNGRIKSYLFELKIMPPSTSTQLTDDEKKLIECWLNNGAPEN